MKLLMILNTPPPYQGTTIMNQFLLDTLKERNIVFTYLRIDSSKELKTMGRLNLGKIRSAWHVLKGIYSKRRDYVTAYLVMSVEGFAFYRHCVFILLILLLRKKCVLHLRGLGFRNKTGFAKQLIRYIFHRSYLIQHSRYNSFDLDGYTCQGLFYVPNGWFDYYGQFSKKIESRFRRTAGPVQVIFLSNLIADKGLFTLAESIKQISLNPEFKDLAVKFNFVGNWENDFIEKTFRDFVQANNLSRYIGHVGPLYNDEKYSFLAGMDILAFPTFYKHETWGNVILEAMIFKIPVIATNYVAIPEMVKNEETGFLIKIGDAQALTDKLILLIRDPERREQMGNRGRGLYLQKFTLDTFKSTIIKTLEIINK